MESEKQAPPTRRESLVPALAVTAVAVAAVAAAVMVQRTESQIQNVAASETARPASAAKPGGAGEVVKAPPLKALGTQPSGTQAMGGSAACKECGVVEMVVAVYEPSHDQPRGYQMHIRMDDGSLRTFEQRGALAAGSRVLVEGNSVKPMS